MFSLGISPFGLKRKSVFFIIPKKLLILCILAQLDSTMKYVFYAIFLLILFTGCSKENPRAGVYWAEFYTVDSNGFNVTWFDNSVQVSNPVDGSITINNSTISKKGSHVSGIIFQMDPFQLTNSGLSIDGTWKRKGGYFRITGNYVAFTTTGENTGTFRMESY